MANISSALQALYARILDGSGQSSPAQRRAAFDGVSEPELQQLIEKVRVQAHRIVDEDVQRVLAAGFSEDQVFELAVCAAVGKAKQQYDAALTALAAASGKE